MSSDPKLIQRGTSDDIHNCRRHLGFYRVPLTTICGLLHERRQSNSRSQIVLEEPRLPSPSPPLVHQTEVVDLGDIITCLAT